MRTNIAIGGLTAAGKTTHSKLLAKRLGYEYVSATTILLEILSIPKSDTIWLDRYSEVERRRAGDAVDIELGERLHQIARSCDGVVFDTWAMAWIGEDPLLRVWIDSDLQSRVRKCVVSAGMGASTRCPIVVGLKDEDTRARFKRLYDFDLCADFGRYDAVLSNTHLIPVATRWAADAGIARFEVVVESIVCAALSGSLMDDAEEILSRHPLEVVRIGRTDSI